MSYPHKCGPKEGRWVRMQSAERLFLVSGSFFGQQHTALPPNSRISAVRYSRTPAENSAIQICTEYAKEVGKRLKWKNSHEANENAHREIGANHVSKERTDTSPASTIKPTVLQLHCDRHRDYDAIIN
uniref:Uncharacterized protein n=1 Tax=Heterorhabditis bacteriophora TaxID=37862 RepID=A0A1I7WH68_HETBA